MLTGWLIATALAADPILDLHASGLVDDRLGGGAGGGIGAAWPHAELMLSLDAAFSSDAEGVLAQGLARPRLHLFPAAAEGPRGHLVLGAGAWSGPRGLVPALEAGAGFDLGKGALRPRIVASFVGGPGEPGRALLTLGVVRHPSPEPTPTPVAEIPSFDAAMVWVPDPVCEWLPPDDAGTRWGEDPPATDPETTTLIAVPKGAGAEEGPETALVGDLVVAAFPGDHVTVEGARLSVDSDGVAWTQGAPGRHDIVIMGAGRETRATVALAAAGTVWYAAPAPEEHVRVLFDAGSADIVPSASASLAAFRDLLGGWHVELWGSFSPEGNALDNEELAMARAQAVARALEATGVDPAHIRVLPARLPEEGLSPEQQRAAVLTPVEPR